MGTIIGDGITFDDVLLIPAYSQVIPNQVHLTTEHPADECGHGHRYRASDGDCYGAAGRNRSHSQEYVDRSAGRGSG